MAVPPTSERVVSSVDPSRISTEPAGTCPVAEVTEAVTVGLLGHGEVRARHLEGGRGHGAGRRWWREVAGRVQIEAHRSGEERVDDRASSVTCGGGEGRSSAVVPANVRPVGPTVPAKVMPIASDRQSGPADHVVPPTVTRSTIISTPISENPTLPLGSTAAKMPHQCGR